MKYYMFKMADPDDISKSKDVLVDLFKNLDIDSDSDSDSDYNPDSDSENSSSSDSSDEENNYEEQNSFKYRIEEEDNEFIKKMIKKKVKTMVDQIAKDTIESLQNKTRNKQAIMEDLLQTDTPPVQKKIKINQNKTQRYITTRIIVSVVGCSNICSKTSKT